MIQFEFPHNFYFLFILPLIHVFFIKRLRQLKINCLHFTGAKRVLRYLYWRHICFLFAAFFLICALAVPQWGSRLVSVRKRGTSIFFVMDISRSMTVMDTPPSRLELSKQFVKILIHELQESACGLVLAKGDGILSVPLSFSHEEIINTVDVLSPLMSTSIGTNLEAGLMRAIRSFPKNHAAAKIIILCTDGDATEGNLLHVAPQIMQEGITLIIVGIGTVQGADIKIINAQNKEVYVRTQLKEDFLMQCVSDLLNDSMYISILEPNIVGKILHFIDKKSTDLSTVVYEQKPVRRVHEMAVLAGFFFLLFFFSGEIRWGK